MLDTFGGATDLEIVRGDTRTITCTVDNPLGDPQPLSGYTPYLTVKADPADNDSIALFQVTGTVTDATAGVVSFALTNALTSRLPGCYFYDVKVISADGTNVRTVVPLSKFTIIWDETRVPS
jgi:hypothetical protein